MVPQGRFCNTLCNHQLKMWFNLEILEKLIRLRIIARAVETKEVYHYLKKPRICTVYYYHLHC